MFDKLNKKWQRYQKTHARQIQKNKETFSKIWYVLRTTGVWAYKLRSVILAIPVAMTAVILAIRNLSALPEQIGFDLQASGEYALLVNRSIVIVVPLALTALSLLLVFCSKKVLYPWLISVFTLALPIFAYFMTVFPG